jgi:hypothetical protein
VLAGTLLCGSLLVGALLGGGQALALSPVNVPTAEVKCAAGTSRQEQSIDDNTQAWCETSTGLRQGPEAGWYASGQLQYTVENHQGRRHGAYVQYWPGTSLRAKGQYESGLRTGEWLLFDQYGWQRKGALRADAPDGPWQVVAPEGGAPRASGAYQNGARQGPWTFFEGGAKIGEGSYDKGRFGTCTGRCPMLQRDTEVEESVDALARGAQDCYRAQWKSTVAAQQTSVTGEVELAWQIGLDGAVQGAKIVRETLPQGSARACLIALVSGIRLPTPTQAINSSRIFIFRPKSGFTDNIEAAGACTSKELRPVINVGRETLMRCVKGALTWPPPRPGQVQIRFAVTADGSLSGVGTEPHFDNGLTHCVSTEVARWKFDAGKACNARYTLQWQ